MKRAKTVVDAERRRREDDHKRFKTETEGLQVGRITVGVSLLANHDVLMCNHPVLTCRLLTRPVVGSDQGHAESAPAACGTNDASRLAGELKLTSPTEHIPLINPSACMPPDPLSVEPYLPTCLQVAEFGGDASRASQRVRQLEGELARAEGAASGAAERAAASEERDKGRSETIMELHGELAKLRER